MPQLDEILVCPVCGFQRKLRDLPDYGCLNFCPKCNIKGQYHGMMTLEAYKEKQRKEELEKLIYCRDCEHMGPVESFPFDAPEDDDYRERRCPHCASDNLINASCVRFCAKCGERPAVEEPGVSPSWCAVCSEKYAEELEAAYWSSRDLEYPD